MRTTISSRNYKNNNNNNKNYSCIKNEKKKSDKNSDILHIYAPNIDCGNSFELPGRSGSYAYTHSMFLSRN